MDADHIILNDERAAEMLGTTARRVRAWVNSGKLPGRKLPDGAVVVILRELVRWIEANDKAVSHA